LLRRDKPKPARFLNREILILRRVVIARQKANQNAAPSRLNLASRIYAFRESAAYLAAR
jgi:putative smr protein/mutS2